MSQKSNLKVTLIGIAILLVSVAIVLLLVMMPRIAANREQNARIRAMEQAWSFGYLSVVDPIDRPETFGAQDAEARLTDADAVRAFTDRILVLLRDMRYGGTEQAVAGNWDVRVRYLVDGEIMDIYLREQDLYFARGSTRMIFTPRDMAAYTALRQELIALLPTAET